MQLKREAEWSELMFSYLTAAWYDWTVAYHLYLTRTHGWSVSAAYYSHYKLGASLLHLYKGNEKVVSELRRVSRSHARMCAFFANDISGSKTDRTARMSREEIVSMMADTSGTSTGHASGRMKEIGSALKLGKKVREEHTYQVLVITHQYLSHDILTKDEQINVNETVARTNELMLTLTDKLNRLITGLIVDSIREMKSPAKHYHLKHFKEEIRDFYEQVEKEKGQVIPAELTDSICQAEKVADEELDEELCPRYCDFRSYKTAINQKWQIYRELEDNMEKLTQMVRGLTF